MDEGKISWNAPSYDQQEHSADWYWATGIIAVSLAIAFFIAHNALLSLIIIIGVGTLLAYAKQPPEMIEYELSRRGVRAGKTLYPWESLESFWILEERQTEKEYASPKILLTSQKPFMPQIVIPLGTAPIEEVRDALANMLPEEPRIESLPDRIIRKLGF
ncbi:MAG: hypothetical protein ACYCZ7_00700 [Minisyncoccota bacterium]